MIKVYVLTNKGAPSHCKNMGNIYQNALSLLKQYLISSMNGLNGRSGTRSLSTTMLLLPAVGLLPAAAAAAAKGAALGLKA